MQATLSENDADLVRRVLGYPPSSPWMVLPQFQGEYSQDTIDRVLQILEEIDEINSLRRQARQESMGVQMDDLKLNYAQHLGHLRSDREELRRELSLILDYPIYGSPTTSSTVTHYQ